MDVVLCRQYFKSQGPNPKQSISQIKSCSLELSRAHSNYLKVFSRNLYVSMKYESMPMKGILKPIDNLNEIVNDDFKMI